MAEMIEGSPGLESTTIGIYRTAATVKGGRRFSFGALVALGDRNGSVAIRYGNAPGVPAAIDSLIKSCTNDTSSCTAGRCSWYRFTYVASRCSIRDPFLYASFHTHLRSLVRGV